MKSSYSGGAPSKIITAPTCIGWRSSSMCRNDASSGVSRSCDIWPLSSSSLSKSSLRPYPWGGSLSHMAQEVVHTEAEWRELLTPEQYKVLREKDTERPWSGEYCSIHAVG